MNETGFGFFDFGIKAYFSWFFPFLKLLSFSKFFPIIFPNLTSKAHCIRSILLTIIMRPSQYTDCVDVDVILRTVIYDQYISKRFEIYWYQYIEHNNIERVQWALELFNFLRTYFNFFLFNCFFLAIFWNEITTLFWHHWL